MQRYLILWEGDSSKQPVDFKERAQAYKQALAMVKQDLDSGILKDWGKFIGQLKGYWVAEGSDYEIGLMMEKYIPFFTFSKIYPVVSHEKCDEYTDVMVK